MNWNMAGDVWIACLLLFGAAWPIMTRQRMRISVPLKGTYTASLKLQIFLQALYVSIAAWFLWPVILRIAGKK